MKINFNLYRWGEYFLGKFDYIPIGYTNRIHLNNSNIYFQDIFYNEAIIKRTCDNQYKFPKI